MSEFTSGCITMQYRVSPIDEWTPLILKKASARASVSTCSTGSGPASFTGYVECMSFRCVAVDLDRLVEVTVHLGSTLLAVQSFPSADGVSIVIEEELYFI